jgi:hypothetical protein
MINEESENKAYNRDNIPNKIPCRRKKEKHNHAPYSWRNRPKIAMSKKGDIACLQKWRCAICQNLLPWPFDLDHIRALHDGGTNQLNNLQAICQAPCHARKSLLETQKRVDRLEEVRTRTSKYFQPSSVFYLPPTPCFYKKPKKITNLNDDDDKNIQ